MSVQRSVLLLLACAALLASMVAWPIGSDAQERTLQVRGQIQARPLESGSTSLARFRFRTDDSTVLMTSLDHFPRNAAVNVWHRSSDFVNQDGVVLGQVLVRLQGDGDIEFAFDPGAASHRPDRFILPQRRVLTTDSQTRKVGRWLSSSMIEFSVELPAEASASPDEPVGPSRAAQKDLIVAALYGFGDAADADQKTNHDYNDFGCPLSAFVTAEDGTPPHNDCGGWSEPEWDRTYPRNWIWRNEHGNVVRGYREGHSGWDIQTKTRGNEPFYSLTDGVVVARADLSKAKGQYGILAIQDDAGHTVIYLHTSEFDRRIRVTTRVTAGTCLGRQGKSGVEWSGAHIHLEVRDGATTGGSGGAYWISPADEKPSPPSVDPVGYLYGLVSRTQATPKSCDFGEIVRVEAESITDTTPTADGATSSLADLVDGDLIQQRGSGETYVIKRENGKWFRRHVVAYDLYEAVPEWDEANVKVVAPATFRQIWHSPLVNIPSNATDIYVVEEIDEDDVALRHIPNPDAFNRAGCDWDGVFQMPSGEYEHWQERAITQGRQLHAGPTDASYRCP